MQNQNLELTASCNFFLSLNVPSGSSITIRDMDILHPGVLWDSTSEDSLNFVFLITSYSSECYGHFHFRTVAGSECYGHFHFTTVAGSSRLFNKNCGMNGQFLLFHSPQLSSLFSFNQPFGDNDLWAQVPCGMPSVPLNRLIFLPLAVFALLSAGLGIAVGRWAYLMVMNKTFLLWGGITCTALCPSTHPPRPHACIGWRCG